ncbi:radical SAM protein [Coxiella burnetii]|uniref:radical SAM protein n=1 Tax=Coxiella burnetii TaxID=777 RepID=UPI000183CDB9|nr:radical SAM protein [Coxiella burnetii]ACJ18499.1 radical SAM superfamily protein [Coxiella burnetii CbuG_Q212]ATN66881.1 radical SAM protein [Coxiella burnetii]OYK86204.1 radical SAM protein [Coxiella burnetii]
MRWGMKISKTIDLTKRVVDLAYKRPRGWKSLIYNSAMLKFKKTGPLMMPVHISIEPANTCNALCPVCETGKNEMTRKKGRLDIDLFKRLIDEVWSTTSSLMYYFMGEPFLNKHSYEMIRYARERGIFVETCTNGDLVNPEAVIYSDINQISFQLGGMDPETHHRYRVNSDLNKVHKNLYKLIEERRKCPKSNVKVEVGFIVMRHNEHQVDEFLKWAKEIGVDRATVVDPCVRNMLEAHAYLPKDRKYWFYDEEAYQNGVLKPKIIPNNECRWIWHSIQLNWNGDAVPCCRDPLGKHILGNVFENGFKQVWNGEKARKFRERVLTRQDKISLCKLCSGYGTPTLKESIPAEIPMQLFKK